MVLACKSDLDKRISPSDALSIIQRYAGLVEVSSQTESGKKKMRRSLDLFIKMLEKSKSKVSETPISSMSNPRTADPKDKDSGYRNPVSPDALHPPPSPWNGALLSQNQESIQMTAFRVLGNGPSTSPSSAENTNSPSHYTLSSRSPNKPSLPRTAPALDSSPPSPTRSRSLSDLLGDSHRNAKPIRTQLSHQLLQDLQPHDDGAGHLPLDRNRTRSIADIAQEDDLVVKLSNASIDQPSMLPDTLTPPRDKSDENLLDITPLASPPIECLKSLEQCDLENLPVVEVTKKEHITHDHEQEVERSRELEEEPILIMNTKARQKDPYVFSVLVERHPTYSTHSPPNPYATLDELLDKLFFVAVSGDGSSFYVVLR